MRDFIHEAITAISVLCSVLTLGFSVWNTLKIHQVQNQTNGIEERLAEAKRLGILEGKRQMQDEAPDIT